MSLVSVKVTEECVDGDNAVWHVILDSKTLDDLIMAGIETMSLNLNKRTVDLTESDYQEIANTVQTAIKNIGEVRKLIDGFMVR